MKVKEAKKISKKIKEIKVRNYEYIETYKVEKEEGKEEISLPVKEYYEKYKVLRVEEEKVVEKIKAKRKDDEIKYEASMPGEYVLFGGNRKLPILGILILLAALILMGSALAYSQIPVVKETVNEILHIDKPTAPEITSGGGLNWQPKTVVKVKKDSYSYSGIAYYEYCVREKEDFENCKWEKTETKNALIDKNGIYHVVFRGVSKKGNVGDISKSLEILIDNIAPKINEVKTKEGKEKITVEIQATDNLSGIKEYYYSTDGETFIKGSKEIEVEKGTKKVIIRVEDKAGNITEVEIDLNKVLEKEENKEEATENENTEEETPEENEEDKKEDPKKEDEEDKEIEKELKAPIINLDKVPKEMTYGDSYKLPSYYEFDEEGGEVYCYVDGKEVTNTKELSIGYNTIRCIAKGNNGINTSTKKEVMVAVPEGEDEEWNGWIRMTLYFPENSTDWQWRLGDENTTRDGEENGWQDYTGPIYVKIEDVENVYIRYKINGEEVIIPPAGKLVVDIEPEKYSILKEETTKVKITYDKTATKKEYRINGGEWQEYTGSFSVGPDTLIDARASKNERIYDEAGDYLTTRKVQTTDSVYIREYIEMPIIAQTPGNPVSPTKPQGPTGGTYDPQDPTDPQGPTTPKPTPRPSTYLAGPIISQDTKEIVESTLVYVTPQEAAEKIYVSINNGTWKEYEGPITITNNCEIKAYYVRLEDGKVSDKSYYYVQNIYQGQRPYVRIDAEPSRYLSETVEEVEVTISGRNYDTLEYSLDGVVYLPYEGSFKVNKTTYVYAKGINEYGEKIERIKISTYTSPAPIEKLDVVIMANPASAEEPIEKTTITIEYDERATKRYYKIGYHGTLKEYEGPFEVTENTTIYAYATRENAAGEANKRINFLTTGISAPEIKVDPTTPTDAVEVEIEYAETSVKNEYKINDGAWKEYTKPIEILENNTTIMARNTDLLGHTAISTKHITNVVGLPKYLLIDQGKYFIIKLNYPTSSKEDTREYKWQIDGTWKKYDPKGILLIKPEFKDTLLANADVDGVKVIDENGREIIFTDHYYLVDKALNILMENIFMRWDTAKPEKPLFVLSEEGVTNKVEVGILYDKTSTKKEYKVIKEDGTTEGWKEYKGAIEVLENNTKIFARSENSAEVKSEIASITITNIDNDKPKINAVDVIGVGSSNITVRVEAEDKTSKVARYAYSLDGEEYRSTPDNEYTFRGLKKETEYTIYIKVYDEADNESKVEELKATTTDIGEISYLTTPTQEEWSTKKTVIINYPSDAYNGYQKEYSLDLGETWKPYEGPIEVEEEGITIISRVIDGPNMKGYATLTVTKIDKTEPTISLEGLPTTIIQNTNQRLPISYTDGPSGSTRKCTINGTTQEYTNTKTMPAGDHTLTCKITTGAGLSASTSKNISIVQKSVKGDSILSILEENDLQTGYYNFTINDTNEVYPVHLYTYNSDQTWTETKTFGDANDVGTASAYAKNMVIVKVNGDLTIASGATVQPYSNAYGGPKGFTLYVTGTLTNNGTIDNSHGAYAVGQNVYLWKNANGTYEYVPAVGALGGAGKSGSGAGNPGNSGSTISPRATGGGGSGGGSSNASKTGAGGTGSSYSGGPGGGGAGQAKSTTAGSNYGGSGGQGASGSGGAGNPGGSGNVKGNDGTGGLITIYANNYINKGTISAHGTNALDYTSYTIGGSSGGGSINIFTNQSMGINQLGVLTNARYSEILGSATVAGGYQFRGGAGGDGTVNIGEIRDGQYYDLKQIIEQDKEAYKNKTTLTGDSILSIVNEKINKTGYYNLKVNGENYPVHAYVFNGNQEWTENKTFGDANDISKDIPAAMNVAASRQYAQNMVIVKVKGDLTIASGVTVQPYSNAYGGPKGFTLYVTGKLTNKGIIDNSHGAYAEGQNVYLWKNANNTYEYVPKIGGAGGERLTTSGRGIAGSPGSTVSPRATGGGGSGGATTNGSYTGAGGSGTSYSGGTGGGGAGQSRGATAGDVNGGAGGTGDGGAGGAGNPGGSGSAKGTDGTGGLLVIYADTYENRGYLKSIGQISSNDATGGGSSGGGSINIFTNQPTGINQLGIIVDARYSEILGLTDIAAGAVSGKSQYGGAGGDGTVNIGEIRDGQYYDLKQIIEQDKEIYKNKNTITGDSILSIVNEKINKTGYYNLKVNGETYPVHAYVFNEDQEWTENKTFGDANDISRDVSAAMNASASRQYAQNMVIVKVKGDLTIASGVTVQPYSNAYGGPKGFTLYVTGTLTNNGTIDNSHGAYAVGQNVYLWKNANGTYEYVPAIGALGGAGKSGSGAGNPGNSGSTISPRATGGGGSGGGSSNASKTGAGGTGSSYSGGPGGGGAGQAKSTTAGSNYGGSGGQGASGSGGAGNPGGSGNVKGNDGTGGLITIYANNCINKGTISAHGTNALDYTSYTIGGSSGGGSINIFYMYSVTQGTTNVAGGYQFRGSAGGEGTVSYTQVTMPEVQPQAFSLRPTELVENPTISIDTANWSITKKVTIEYPDEEYTNEYSLDNGITWKEYTGEITVEKETTILARSKDGEKTVSASTFTITKIDNEEPEINILLEDRIIKGTSYQQVANVTYPKSGGVTECTIDNNDYLDISKLDIGKYTITCTTTTGSGKITTKSKEIEIYEEETQEEEPLEEPLPEESEE